MASCVYDGEDYLIPIAAPREHDRPLFLGLLIAAALVAAGLMLAVGRTVLA
jgi:hypothetical protein